MSWPAEGTFTWSTPGTLLTLQGTDVVGPELGLLRQGDVLGVQIHGHDAGRLLQLNKRKYLCVYNYFQCVHKKVLC